MLKTIVEIAAYGVAAMLSAVCILAWAWKWGGWSWSVLSRQLRRSVLAVMVAMSVVVTIKAQKGNRGNGTTGDPPATAQQTGTTGVSPVEDITDRFHFSAISVPTSGTVMLTTAWTNGFLTAGQTIDILVKTDLRDETWSWLTNGVVAAGSTNMTWTIENQSPSNSFYKAVVRESLTDMDDPDGDGLPNVYELAHGRNPWVNDYALVHKLTVGPNGEFSDIFSALSANEGYSIISVTSGVYQVNGGVQMPPHPVMVTCEKDYAVFSGASPTAMFLLGNGHDSGHTLFRNLYLNLTSTSGLQAGFWCGGGLPWESPGASAVFENVHIRAPNPGVEYFGWLFYAPCDVPAVIRGCCVNASGAEWIYAVFGDNPPPIVIESCTFVNFPNQSLYQSAAIGLRSTYTNGAITSTPPVTVSRTLFDDSFTNAWPLVRFENASNFPVTMTDCIRPSEPASHDFMPDVTNDVLVLTSQVAWAGFPLTNSPAATLGIGAFAPLINDPLANMDGDALSDYDEVYAHGTDPFLADSDNDGVLDAVEIFVDHTDPTNPHSFKQNLTVTVTNTASTAYAVYTAWGYSPTNWEANGLVTFPYGYGMNLYTNASSQGATHVKAFCDLNGNGEYEADYDILLVRAIPYGDTARFNFTFGDIDGDGLSDAQERQYGTDPYLFDSDNDGVDDGTEISDGTDPMNQHSFTQRLFVTVTNTASTTYAVYTAWGDSTRVWEANEQVIFPQGFGDTTYTNASPQGATHLKAFCDLNGNDEYDANTDVLLMYQIPNSSTARIALAFGDVDGDGVPDAQERSEGTDPYDGGNFRLVAMVNVESSDVVPGLTNYVAWGNMPTGWEENGLDSFAGRSLPFPVDAPATNGELFVKVFRDFNTNGVYDAGLDVLITKKLAKWDNGKTVMLNIGDIDRDYLLDSEEIKESTDPFDGINYCFRLAVEVTGIFHTTNNLTLSATFGDTTPCAPTVIATNVWSMDFGHLLATNGEKVVLTIWDDANSNLVCDVEETFYRRELGPTGHVNVISFNMPYGNFDRDNNSLPDWWEALTGLSSVTNGGPYVDTDGDGLINLHEYWAGCNPFMPDGSNTLLSVTARAVDNRLFRSNPVSGWHVYSNYGMLITNPVCWVSGIDISCASLKNSTGHNMRSATAISPRHVIMATHFSAPIGTEFSFLGNDGIVYARTLVAANCIQDSDINIGLLDESLPATVAYARILPSNYSDYIGTGRSLPTLVFDYERKALVMDLQDLPVTKGILASCRYSPNPLRALFGEELISGDSGNPRFLIIGDQVVLLNTLWKGGAGSGAFLTLWRSEIQEAMDMLAMGYQLEVVDLSTFDMLDNPNREAK